MRKRDSDRFQIPLMFAFRDAFDAKDARKRIEERRDGERVISGRGSLKRRGTDEIVLKKNLAVDLLALVNTIDLASAVDLGAFEHISRSILNFGLRDVASLTSEEAGVDSLARDLSTALASHEPRLDPDTLQVVRDRELDDVNQRIRFTVSAEMFCAPLDIPIEFVAEIDVGSGKVQLTRLPVST